MMVTPSMFMTGAPPQEKAILNPPVNVQRAVIVTQENFEANKSTAISTTAETRQGSSKIEAIVDAPVKSPVPEANKQGKNNGNNWIEQRAISPTPKTLGRQKRIIEPSITPATTPISYSSPTSMDEMKSSTSRPMPIKNFQRINEFGSPDSPLSKMNVLMNPLPHINQDKVDNLISPQR